LAVQVSPASPQPMMVVATAHFEFVQVLEQQSPSAVQASSRERQRSSSRAHLLFEQTPWQQSVLTVQAASSWPHGPLGSTHCSLLHAPSQHSDESAHEPSIAAHPSDTMQMEFSHFPEQQSPGALQSCPS
jgi:hypothetical protein